MERPTQGHSYNSEKASRDLTLPWSLVPKARGADCRPLPFLPPRPPLSRFGSTCPANSLSAAHHRRLHPFVRTPRVLIRRDHYNVPASPPPAGAGKTQPSARTRPARRASRLQPRPPARAQTDTQPAAPGKPSGSGRARPRQSAPMAPCNPATCGRTARNCSTHGPCHRRHRHRRLRCLTSARSTRGRSVQIACAPAVSSLTTAENISRERRTRSCSSCRLHHRRRRHRRHRRLRCLTSARSTRGRSVQIACAPAVSSLTTAENIARERRTRSCSSCRLHHRLHHRHHHRCPPSARDIRA